MNDILIVDDDAAYLRMMTGILQSFGITSVAVTSGELALTELAKQNFKLMMTDLNMPGGVNGFDLIIEAKWLAPNMPTILITASKIGKFLGDVKDLGIGRVIAKPVYVDQIIHAIEEVTGGTIKGVRKNI